MGISPHINADTYPEQGTFVGRRVKVCYEYDTSRMVEGVILRDDKTEPGLLIIHTDDGRALLGTECMYSLI